MALLFFDSFDAYGTTVGTGTAARPQPSGIMGKGRWNLEFNVGEIRMKNSDDVRGVSDNSISAAASTVKTGITTNAILIAGVQLSKVGSWSSGTTARNLPLISFYEGTTESFMLRLCGNGLAIRLGTGVLQPIPFFSFELNKKHFVEFKAYCHDTAGYFEVRVNGVKIHEESGIDTKASTLGYYDRVLCSHVFNGIVDNFYVCDGSGGDFNDFLGPVRVSMLRPTSEIVNTFNTGNYTDFDEEQLDTGNYAQCDGDVGQIVESGFQSCPDYETVLAVQVTSDVSSDANTVFVATANSSTNLVKSANMSTDSTNISTYNTRHELFTTNPDAGSWTPNTVNSTAFGTEVQ